MAVPKPIIMRGLKIPDANFRWPLGESWTAGTSIVNTFPHASDDEDTGRSLIIPLDGLAYTDPQNYIHSAFSPYGVAAGPYADAPVVQYFWLGAIARTREVSASTTGILKALIVGYGADGNYITSSSSVDLYDEDGNTFYYSDTFKLWRRVLFIYGADISSVRYWRLRFRFSQNDTGNADEMIELAWAGVGCPIGVGVDALSTWSYAHDAAVGTTNAMRRISPAGTFDPMLDVKEPAHSYNVSVSFPYLTNDDKDIIRKAYRWNRGTPTSDVESRKWTASHQHIDRGTAQPIIVAFDRIGLKRAFYADFNPQFTQSAITSWPESSPYWAAPITFTERLF